MKEDEDMLSKQVVTSVVALLGVAVLAGPAVAEKKYDPGASDSEIKIGNTEACSGSASAYGVIGKTEAAYFKMVNDQGGVNGRKISVTSLDDGYSPPKTVEMTRQLIEQDEVLFDFVRSARPTNSAIQKYLSAKTVPQLSPGEPGLLRRERC